MSDGEVVDFAVLAIDEIDAVGVAGIDLDTGIPLTLDDQALHVEQCQLTAVGLALADHQRCEPRIVGGYRHPATTVNVAEIFLTFKDAREVQMHSGSNDHGTVVAQRVEEFLLIGNAIVVSTIHFVRAASVVVETTREVAFVELTQVAVIVWSTRKIAIAAHLVRNGLLALDELDVQLFDDAEFDGIVVGARLVPRLTSEIILQVLRLKLPAVTCENLVTHQAQFILREIGQIGGVHQPVRQQFAGIPLFCRALLTQAVLEIIWRQRHLPHSVAIGFAYGKEIHAVLTDILYAPANLRTQGLSLYFITRKDVLTLLTCDLRQVETETALVFTDATHRDVVANDFSSIKH